MIIEINKLGLAAYIKMKGGVLLDVKGRTFTFDTDKTATEWEIEYLNSESYRHDSELVRLRNLMNKGDK